MGPDPGLTQLESLVRYTAWSGMVVLQQCSMLSSEQMTRDLGGTQGSLLTLLRHIFDAERGWLQMLQQRSIPPLAELGGASVEHAPETLDELASAWPQVWSAWMAWVAFLEPNDLRQEMRLLLPDQTEKGVPLWSLVLHALNHSSLHRGQAVTMLRMLGAPCRNVDLMGFLLSSGE